ncbi:MAG: 16S rRNA (adenine(1518)-N(6)/adenine(1519)-N(6))-dimethyltransferase RsmA [Acidimicrobiia bacterium]
MTQTPSQIRDLLRRYQIAPRKSLGQHFLADPNITAKIAALAPVALPIVEVGAGTGALTVALADAGHEVIAYEVDERLRPVLEEVLEGVTGVELRFADAMDVDLADDVAASKWALVGNLPYNIATPLILDVLRHVPAVGRFVVMVQTEVAERFVARPGTKSYGVPSVVTQLYGLPALEFRVPPQLFVPPPAVGSAVIIIDRRPDVRSSASRAADLAAAAFGQRRKMIRSSLADAVPNLTDVLARAAVADDLRADALRPADYLAIAEAEAA